MLIEGIFRCPTILKVFYILFDIVFLLNTILGFALDIVALGAFCLAFLLVFGLFTLLHMSAIRACKLEVTNKRIKGVRNLFIAKKQFSYRLDEIDHVELGSSLGCNTIDINFSNGGGAAPVVIRNGLGTTTAANIFRMSCLKNGQEVYDKLCDLLASVKNEMDLKTDIEMAKIEVENKKATAMESMASNMAGGSAQHSNNNSSYINELKELKGLLDAGIITQAEFDEKKAKLLK